MGAADQRFITQLFIVEITSIERLQAALDVLSDPALTPLPQRYRRHFAAMRSHLERMRHELETRPEAVAGERAREERRRLP